MGYVALTEEGLVLTSIGDVPDVASWLIKQLEERDAQLQQPVLDEHGCAIGLQTIVIGEPQYLEAVRDELRRASLRVHLIDGMLIPALTQISTATFSAVIRTQVVPEILGLDPEHALLALQAVLNTDVRN